MSSTQHIFIFSRACINLRVTYKHISNFEISPNLGAIARVGRPERPSRPRQRPQRVLRHRSHPGHPRTTGDYARLLDIAKREGAQGFRSYGGAVTSSSSSSSSYSHSYGVRVILLLALRALFARLVLPCSSPTHPGRGAPRTRRLSPRRWQGCHTGGGPRALAARRSSA